MSLFAKILGKKKKKAPSCNCKTCGTLLEAGEGHALTSSQIILSRKYWDGIMLEPETKSYTIAHFEGKDPAATQMRAMIFKRSADFKDPWIICDTCVNMFDVDKQATQKFAAQWWETEKSFRPPSTGIASENMEANTYEEVKEYAVMMAGQDRI